jgi:ankyrin repeat protein
MVNIVITKNKKMTYSKVGIGIIFIALVLWAVVHTEAFKVFRFLVVAENVLEKNSDTAKPETYFKSKKVQKFCYALIENDFETTDELLKNGLDINTIGDKVEKKRENEYAPTPLAWLFLGNKDTLEKLKAFKYLLDNGADLMIVYDKYDATILFKVAGYKYPDYLKLVLTSKQIKKENLNIALNSGTTNTPLLRASAMNKFKNFKLLLNAGADINWVEERTKRTTLHYCAMDGDWKYAYELLTRGVDYEKDLKRIIQTIEMEGIGSTYSPVTAINWDGIDDRQKVVQFFRDRGIEIKPGTNPGEKYVSENGDDVLYINENILYKKSLALEDRKGIEGWIKFSESEFNEHTTKDPDEQHYLDKEIEKLKIEELK